MKRTSILGDILSVLFERDQLSGPGRDKRDIYALCRALVSVEGDVSGHKLAASVLSRYRTLKHKQKIDFFYFLNDQLDLDPERVSELALAYKKEPTPEAFRQLSAASEPERQKFLRRLNQPIGATADIVAMRVDLLRLLNDHPNLARTDHDFVDMLKSWFNRGFLVLRTIDWDTPARILDKIIEYEAVHEISDLDDLRKRLYPQDRHCFAFFHPSMPDEPLIFVEVALTERIPSSITELLTEGRATLEAEKVKTAVFYSISNCQKGLTGISFGNLLIKQVVAELSQQFPQISDFVTLSPIPGLNEWLSNQTGNTELSQIALEILENRAKPQDLRAMAASYLLNAKRKDGSPIDPVARFHLTNGAKVHNIHANADLSPNGIAQSSGVMVNYRYELSEVEKNHENFAYQSIVAADKPARALSKVIPY